MIFPTIYSTLDPMALATFVSVQYGLGNCQCKLILRGVGDTYLINTERKKLVLRIYRNSHRTFAHIQAEVELLNTLHSNDVSVSYPIADNHGQYIQSLYAAEGMRHAVLFSYAAGESPNRLNDFQLKILGGEVAKFHNVSSVLTLNTTRWTFDIQTTLIAPINTIRPFFETIPDEFKWWTDATTRAREMLDSLSFDNASTGYCHYDILPKNFHFDGDNVTLFDFDFFGTGLLVNDLMSFWSQLCIEVNFKRMTQAESDRSFHLLLDSYCTYRAISKDELRAIPSLAVGWWCFYMGFHATHDQFIALIQPGHLKMRTAFIRQLVEANSTWSDQFN